MAEKFVEKGWQSYRQMVVPKDAPDVQVRECRQAFYAGAAILFSTIQMVLDDGDEPTEADLQRMQALQDELDEFGQLLDLRYLKAAGRA